MTTDNPDPLEVWREACLAKSILNNHDENERAAAAIIAQHYAPVIADLEALVGELGEALKLYGLHLASCLVEKATADELERAICTCGLSATLAKLEKAC